MKIEPTQAAMGRECDRYVESWKMEPADPPLEAAR
jgi:hypothetical protein